MPNTVNIHYHSGDDPDVRLQTVPNSYAIAFDFDGVRLWFATKEQAREALRQAHLELLQLELADMAAEVAS